MSPQIIDTSNIDTSPLHELHDIQALELPDTYLSDPLGDPEECGDDDDASLTFEDLMGMSTSTDGNSSKLAKSVTFQGDLLGDPEKFDDDDDASLTFEDLMRMSTSTVGNSSKLELAKSVTFQVPCEIFSEDKRDKTQRLRKRYNDSFPSFGFRSIQIQNEKRKKKKKKERKEKKEPKENQRKRSTPKRSVSISADALSGLMKDEAPPPRRPRRIKSSSAMHRSLPSVSFSAGSLKSTKEALPLRLRRTKSSDKFISATPKRSVSISADALLGLMKDEAPPPRRPRRIKSSSAMHRSLPSVSFSTTGSLKSTKETVPLRPRRTKSSHKCISAMHRSVSSSVSSQFGLDEEERRRRPVSPSAAGAFPLEFGASFSSIAHSSGLQSKAEHETERKRSFKSTLDLVGKWKIMAEREDRHSFRTLRSVAAIDGIPSLKDKPENAIIVLESKETNEPERRSTSESSAKKKEKEQKKSSWYQNATSESALAAALEQVNQNLESCTKKKEKKSSRYQKPTAEYLLLAAVLEQENQNRESSIMKKEKKKKKSSRYQKPTPKSLADALEVKENWLIEYLTNQSPQMKRQQVDDYWVEAFKRNYERRRKIHSREIHFRKER
jgi:hypothetical protein